MLQVVITLYHYTRQFFQNTLSSFPICIPNSKARVKKVRIFFIITHLQQSKSLHLLAFDKFLYPPFLFFLSFFNPFSLSFIQHFPPRICYPLRYDLSICSPARGILKPLRCSRVLDLLRILTCCLHSELPCLVTGPFCSHVGLAEGERDGKKHCVRAIQVRV